MRAEIGTHRGMKLGMLLILVVLILGGATSARAASTITTRLRIPVSDAFNSCTGEAVDLSGYVEFVVHTTVDSSGGFHSITEVSLQGVSGVSASGVRYRATGQFWKEYNTKELQLSQTDVVRYNLISQGSGDNFRSYLTFHATVTATGEATVYIDNETEGCHG